MELDQRPPKLCMTLIPRIYFVCSTLYGPCSVWLHWHNLLTRRIKKIFKNILNWCQVESPAVAAVTSFVIWIIIERILNWSDSGVVVCVVMCDVCTLHTLQYYNLCILCLSPTTNVQTIHSDSLISVSLYLGKIEKFRLLCGMWWLTGMWTDVTYLSVTRVMQPRHKLNNLSRSMLQSRYYTTDTIFLVTGRCTCWVANDE